MEIAALRKVGFTIDSIIQMKDDPDRIEAILDTQYYMLKESAEHSLQLIHIFEKVREHQYSNIKELAERLHQSTSHISLPSIDIEPNFSKFESATKEEREEGYLQFRVTQRLRERRERFLEPVRKVASFTLILCCIFFLLFIISAIPRRINREYTGVQFYINSEDDIETTNIRIKGKYYKRWFSVPRFEGDVEIDNIKYTKEYDAYLIFDQGAKNEAVLKAYMGSLRTKTIARVYLKKNFKQITFLLYTPVTENSGFYADLVLCAPAKNRSEGMKVLEDMKLDWLKRFNAKEMNR